MYWRPHIYLFPPDVPQCSKIKDHSLAMRLKKVSESAGNSGIIDNPIQFL